MPGRVEPATHRSLGAWFDGRTIRTRIALLVLAVLLPLAAALGWFLAADVRQARDAARDQVGILANRSAAELQRILDRSQTRLEHLAARPGVKALDGRACDSFAADGLLLEPAVVAIAVRRSGGALVCDHAPRSGRPLVSGIAERIAAGPVADGAFAASPVIAGEGQEPPLTLLSVPIRDDGGVLVGRLQVAIDLAALNRHLFAGMPQRAVVTVVDPGRAVLLRSTAPETYIGQRPAPNEVDPARGAREGYLEAVGRDGVPRLLAFVTLPDIDWRVVASLPADDVYAPYRGAVQRAVLIAGSVGLIALVLVWRLGATIVRPVTTLRDVALRVAAGELGTRSPVSGPPEIRAVALAFNRMLDARTVSELRLRGIFDTAVDAIITADEDQVIIEANPAAAAMFRLPLEQMIGTPLGRFVPPQYRDRHRQDVRQFGDGMQGARHMGPQREVVALRADGEEFPIEAAISQLTVGGRRLYTVIHRDVSERRRAEGALRDSEARLRRLLTHLPDAVLVDSGNRIVFANQAAQRLFGADEARLLGRSPLELIHADSRALLEACIAGLTGAAPVAPLVALRIVRTDGATREVESLGTLVEHEGDRSIVIVMRDVTDLQQARAALEASHADLTRLVSALDSIQEEERKRIARELHDDLQQTLAAIRMDTGSIAAEMHANPGHVGPLLVRIDALAAAAIASSRRIINDLRPRMLEELGLLAALEALATRFRDRTGIRCEVEVGECAIDDAGLDARVATCLYRVAQEALNNVAKHARAGTVQLRLTCRVDGTLSLRVSDDGGGFAAEDMRKAQSFGLLGMQERVRAVGGSLRIATAPAAGTVLEVDVPTAARRSGPVEPGVHPGPQQADDGVQRQQQGGDDGDQRHGR